jgi:hypothetical protein
MTTNRHPVDELADVRAEIKALQKQEQILRDRILNGECSLTGDDHGAEVIMQRREMLDTKAVRWKFSREELAKFMKTTEVAIVKLSKLGNGDSHEWVD